ncbi:hypothetical protein FRC10_006099 [Ceratobasidium sp. 414]|nr:hypothetical protein FRC10_006099 [Ceratobasidium sp. 414]
MELQAQIQKQWKEQKAALASSSSGSPAPSTQGNKRALENEAGAPWPMRTDGPKKKKLGCEDMELAGGMASEKGGGGHT